MKRRSFLGMLASLPFIGKALLVDDKLPPRKTSLLTNVGTRDVDAVDVITKADFDAAVSGIDWKRSCVAVAHEHVDRYATEIDGVPLKPDDRVLLTAQRHTRQNGVFRFDGKQLLPVGTEEGEGMFVMDGVQGGDTVWVAIAPHQYTRFSCGDIT